MAVQAGVANIKRIFREECEDRTIFSLIEFLHLSIRFFIPQSLK